MMKRLLQHVWVVLPAFCLLWVLEFALILFRFSPFLSAVEKALALVFGFAFASMSALLLSLPIWLGFEFLFFCQRRLSFSPWLCHALGSAFFLGIVFGAGFYFLPAKFFKTYLPLVFPLPRPVPILLGFFVMASFVSAWLTSRKFKSLDENLEGETVEGVFETSIAALCWPFFWLWLLFRKREEGKGWLKFSCILFSLFPFFGLLFLDLSYVVFPKSSGEYHRALSCLLFGFSLPCAYLLSRANPCSRLKSPKAIFCAAIFPFLSILACFLFLGRWQNVKLNICYRTELLRAQFALCKNIFDADNDGFLSLFGGSDPKEFDYARAPHRVKEPPELWRNNSLEHAVPENPNPSRPKRVILIIVDTLRADALGVHGNAKGLTPEIDALARDSVLFERAYSVSSTTSFAVPAILSGLYMDKTRVENLFGIQTLPRLFAKENFLSPEHCAAFSQTDYSLSLTLPDTPKHRADYARKQRGKFVDDSPKLSDDAMQFLNSHRDAPVFLWMHYLSPHNYYRAPEKYKTFTGTVGKQSPKQVYEMAVRYDDAQIGRFMAWLKKEGLYDDSLIVLTADHGEAFGEHGWNYHSINLYQYLIHVPLLIKAPGLAAGRRSESVLTIDIVPSLLHLLGKGGGMKFHGRALFAGPAPAREAEAKFFSIPPHALAAIDKDDRWKIIWHYRADCWELFDLKSDPEEKLNVVDLESTAFSAMKELLFDRAKRGQYEGFWKP